MAARKFSYIDCMAHEAVTCLSDGKAASGVDATLTHVSAGPHSLVIYNEGTNTTRVSPIRVLDANCTNGWELPSTNTDNVGFQLIPSQFANAANPAGFTVGTDPAFYMEAKIGIPDISDYDVMFVGFRIGGAFVGSNTAPATMLASYTDKAGFALADTAGDLRIYTSNDNSDVDTDITDTAWADDAVKTLKVLVSSSGAVTYTINGVAATGAAAFSFDSGDVVIPTICFTKGAAAANTPPICNYLTWGLQ